MISGMNRRAFLKTSLGAGSWTTLALLPPFEAEAASPGKLIDVNVNLGQWPLRRLRLDDPVGLAARLRKHGVRQAWAGSFDGLLHKDIRAVNTWLANECRRHGQGMFVPLGSINPRFPDWEEDLRACAEDYGMRGVRLHPNYHGYQLDAPEFIRLLKLATERHLIVQLAVMMEDERMMHPRLRVESVDIGPLAEAVKQTPGLRLVLLNALGKLHGPALQELIATRQVHVEISMLEGVAGLATLLEQVPLDRVLFGSHAPLFYFESALSKLKESALSWEQAQAVSSANAARLLAG